MMSYDLLEVIFNNLEIVSDLFNFRLIDKEANDIYINYFIKIKSNIVPRSTFINFKECIVCYKKSKTVKQLIYNYDLFPHKNLIHCSNKICYLSSIKRYLTDIKNNNIYPFYIIKNENIQLFKNNNKILNNFYVETLKKYNGKLYIKNCCDVSNKVTYLKIKDCSLLENLNLFNWYLCRKI